MHKQKLVRNFKNVYCVKLVEQTRSQEGHYNRRVPSSSPNVNNGRTVLAVQPGKKFVGRNSNAMGATLSETKSDIPALIGRESEQSSGRGNLA